MAKGSGAGGAGRGAMKAAMGYWGPSVKPRSMMFKQLNSALTTGGGKGFKMPLVQQAMARSRSSGMAALQGANTSMASAGIDPAMRGVIANRMGRQNTQLTNAIGPSVAAQMIAGAPATVANAAGPIASGFSTQAAGAAAAAQQASIRNQGYSALAGGVGQASGTLLGTGSDTPWYSKFQSGSARPTTVAVPAYANGKQI